MYQTVQEAQYAGRLWQLQRELSAALVNVKSGILPEQLIVGVRVILFKDCTAQA